MDSTHDLSKVVGRHLDPPVVDRPLPEDVPLAQLGLDSLASINLLLDLEDTFEVSFPDEMLTPETFRTVGSLRAAVERLRSGAPAL